MSGYDRNYSNDIRNFLDNEEIRLIQNITSSSEISAEVSEFERNLEVHMDQFASLFSSEKRSLETQISLLNKEKSDFDSEISLKLLSTMQRKLQFEENQQKAAALRAASEHLVEINVGGTHTLTTSIATLTSQEDSALAAMFSGRHSIQYHNGKVFFDRDGAPFCDMINYLRTRRLPFFRSPQQEASFLEELNYWNVFLLGSSSIADPSLLHFDPDWCAPTLILEDNCTSIRKLANPHGIAFGANAFSASCPYMEFKISITSPSPNGSHIFVGVVDKSKYNSSQLISTLWKDAPSSWYWDVWSSKLIKTDETGVHAVINGYGCDCEDEEIVIGIGYDSKKQTISYYKKGICQGTAFTGVQSGLYPSIDVWFDTGSVSMLQTRYPEHRKFM